MVSETGVTDLVELAAQARDVIQGLHQRTDVVVRFKSDRSTFKSDMLEDLDRMAPGHFRVDKRVLTLNLDTLVTSGKAMPKSLASVEDFRAFPVLAGVAAHEAGHARYSLWGTAEGQEIPESIPNPDYDASDPESIESFPVSGNGKLHELAKLLEEPRIERLGMHSFTKTWKRAMQLSSTHLILEEVEEMDSNDVSALDSAVRLAVLIGGRLSAGTLGGDPKSRESVNKVLKNAQAIIETALPDADDPYFSIMRIISEATADNNHADPVPHLEAARKIEKIVHPENQDDPDSGSTNGGGEGESSPEAGKGPGEAGADEKDELMEALANALNDSLSDMEVTAREEIRHEEQPEEGGHGGNGATVYDNPKAPQVSHHESPTSNDRDLYRKALAWMQRQVEPTVSEIEVGAWLPGGGARLNIRSLIRDNLANHKGTQRSDWDRVSETVKAAPPVKVAIMLDGSGSMGPRARESASIAWAAANAAAELPESRTVSVVYGAAATVTQAPGHGPTRDLAVSRTDGPWENFKAAAELVEEALWLDDEVNEDEPSNVLIIVVSDLQYHGGGQTVAFQNKVGEWADKGYTTLVVGAQGRGMMPNSTIKNNAIRGIKMVAKVDLFK